MKWSVGKIISKWAMLAPERIALIYEGTPITYRALNRDVNKVARFFKNKGLKKGDRVAVDLFNCPEFLACYFAAAKLGLIFVPLNYRLVPRELEYQINRCGTRLLVFHDNVLQHIEKIRSSVCVEDDKFIFLKTNNIERSDCPGWANDYHDCIQNRSVAEPILEEPVDLDDPLLILYTSGVTGNPKGAVISHCQTYFKNFQIINYTDMRQDDMFLFQSPLCHSAGLCAAATPCFCRGATLLMRMKFDPVIFCRDIEKYRATIVFGFTTMFRFILQAKILDKVGVSSVRMLFGGGEKTSLNILKAFERKGLYLQSGYGQTENSGMVLRPRELLNRKPDSCGLPNFFSEVWVQGRNGKELPPGEVGELVATGPNVMSGYWDAPEETEKAIVDGVLYTGDLGYKDEEGFIYIVDRAKDMYRSGAENVYPAEVESVLSDHPKIEKVAIIGVADETWGETGKAFIVCNKGETITKEEVVEFLSGKVAKYKIPRHIEHIDALPTTLTGKIIKKRLKQM
ncbi:long-chain-fatty-acid--CoA ligase [Desulfosarcina widdelii]|uniref:Long-chain-fatty-acid--CoA ligase n=1 Tax=Desulfosarcina widdelii TaxID=947919 RepID=A0A5K7Z9Y0_9BACT|nr:AMP-binding protein [Desulfosarcina widdelii]BBO77848.1 long-chain-fatty-acid--CoA ligase [Desulfosarcina widdelii]